VARPLLSALEGPAGRRVVLPHVDGALRAYLVASLVRAKRRPIVVAKDFEDAEVLYRDLAFFFGVDPATGPEHGLLLVVDDERSPYEDYSPDVSVLMERLGALYRLAREPRSVRAVVVTPHVLAKRHVPPSIFDSSATYVVARASLDRDRLLSRLVASGYNAVSTVQDVGTFSVRGGIIDVFSPYLSKPVRIDLFGDEVESIRTFDPATQRTLDEREDAVILPAREIVLTRDVKDAALPRIESLGEERSVPTKRLRAVLEDVANDIHYFGIDALLPMFHPDGLVGFDAYLPKGDDVVVVHGPEEALLEQLEAVRTGARADWATIADAQALALPPEAHLVDGQAVLEAAIAGARGVELGDVVIARKNLDRPLVQLEVEDTRLVRAEVLKAARQGAAGGDDDPLGPVTARLQRWRADGYVTLLVAHTRGQAERLLSLLKPKNVSVRLLKSALDIADLPSTRALDDVRGPFRDRSVHAWVVIGDLSGGFVLPETRLAILSEEEIFGQRTKVRRRRQAPPSGAFVSDLAELKAGDFVVHIDHGIAKYHGIVRLAVSGVDGDFLHLEYNGGDKLYLPVHRLRLIQKFASAEEGRSPPLSKLGSQTWISTKAKVKDTLLKMASELLRLYAARAALQGFKLPPPGEAFARFEAEFAYEPTPDQQKAIDDVIRDVQRDFPMDRLVCGDVGYGKTEVAMRATMLAVSAKKQVVVLVPTTVLAAQHYQVFSERFRDFPVRIGIVSRFQGADEQKRTLADLARGDLDVVIGTHRLLSKDVSFADLGMVIIDEEHRFGVKHKEQLKKYRTQVHVLTMSATPIPRTMHMGMMGVRDLSVIATPPVDRLAVKTEVHKFSEEVIRESVLQEIRRGGQCFVVHNRVASIDAVKRMLEKLVPEARVIVGHGQMDEETLEKVMVDFMNKHFNVLLSTTIIESGIDIPNANTIIINRADRMGLAQLYQLRGRVGRGRSRGYAHFLIPPGNLTEDARKRIAVLQRFTDLGAGFKIAAHDLEIRGAGNIIGKDQSGTIAHVGFEMYQALLAEAIEDLKGKGHTSVKEAEVNVPVTALIPDKFIPPPSERLSYYQRFNRAETDEETFNLLQEIVDLYGNPPAEVENLAHLMMLKQRLGRLGALALDYGPESKSMPSRVVIKMDPEAVKLEPTQVVAWVERGGGRRKLLPDGRVMVNLVKHDDPREIVLQAKDIVDELILLSLSPAPAPPPPAPPPFRAPKGGFPAPAVPRKLVGRGRG
jgi:transcription-repair coupling factor (superfamily II helicase)